MIKQFVPQEYCLKCQGCCRFKELESAWSPCLFDEEIQVLLDKDLPAANLSLNKHISPVPHPKGEGFICPFLAVDTNACKIYELRPFECQLYPFLINLRNKRIVLTVDVNCPYMQEHLGSKETKAYIDYLVDFLNSPKQLKLLKDNPHVLAAYEEVKEIVELEQWS